MVGDNNVQESKYADTYIDITPTNVVPLTTPVEALNLTPTQNIINSSVNTNTDTATGGITTDVNANTDIQPKLQSAVGFAALFGDGRDGNVTVSGTTNVNENKQYTNLTISGTLTSSTNKYLHIAVAGTITISGSGKIDMLGKGAISPTTFTEGVDGAGSGAGVEYLDITTRWGASGGGGGAGTGNIGGRDGGDGYSAGGARGAEYSDPGANGVSINQITKDNAGLKPDILLYAWGASGGTGGFNDVIRGGNGGGVIYIEAKNIIISSTSGSITANGGDGEDAHSTSNNSGAGGGGGGIIIIKYGTLTNAQSNNSNFTASGGTGGDGISGSGSGGDGGDGYVFLQQISK